MRLYTVYDRVAQEGCAPFVAKNDDVAARQFRHLMQHEHVENVSDYCLYYLGDFDSEQPSLFGDAVTTMINVEDDDE